MEAAALTAALAGVAAFLASLVFLRTRNFRFDALAAAVTEVGLACLALSVVVGVIRGQAARGRWWSWDAGLTAALVCWLLYAAYLLLRHAVEEPTQRATFAAVFSIFALLDVPVVYVAIAWWRARQPMQQPLWSLAAGSFVWAAALIPCAALLTFLRFRAHERRRERDAERRTVILEDR